MNWSTLSDRYDELLEEYKQTLVSVGKYKEHVTTIKFKVDSEISSHSYDKDISLLLADFESFEKSKNQLERLNFDEFKVDLVAEAKKMYEPLFEKYEDAKSDAEYRLEEAKENNKRNLNNRVSMKEDEVESYRHNFLGENLQLKVDVDAYTLQYRERVEEIFELYGISLQKMFDLKDIPMEELSDLISTSKVILEDTVGNSNIFDKIISLAYLPIAMDIVDDNIKYLVTGIHLLTFFLAAYLLRPYFFAFIGFIYIIAFLARMSKVSARKDLLRLAYSAMGELDLESILNTKEEYLTLREELSQLKKLTTEDADLAAMERRDQEIKEAELLNPKDDFAKLTQEIVSHAEEVQGWVDQVNRDNKSMIDSIKELIESTEGRLVAELNRIASNFKPLGTYWEIPGNEWKALSEEERQGIINDDMIYMNGVYPFPYMNTNLKIGAIKYRDKVLVEESVEVDLESMLFMYKTREEKAEQFDYLKLILTNLLCSSKERSVKVSVFDEINMGMQFGEFMRIGNSLEIFRTVPQPYTEALKYVNTLLVDRIPKLTSMDVQSYNKAMYEEGRMTLDYQIVILPNMNITDLCKPEVTSIIATAHRYGVIVLALIGEELPENTKLDEKEFSFIKSSLTVSKRPFEFMTSNGTLVDNTIFSDNVEPYSYEPELGSKVMATIESCISNKQRNLVTFLHKDLQEYSIPKDKIWTYSTRYGIDLNPGWQDGDKSRFTPLTLGDECVHALMAGATGAGKSATINAIIANMLLKYSPDELDLRLIDFKDAEFHMYAKPRPIPHSRIVTGTRDGLYGLSLFKKINEEMEARNRDFGAVGVNRIVEFNDLIDRRNRELKSRGMKLEEMERGKTPDDLIYVYFADNPEIIYPSRPKIYPRILLIVDEFTVLYNEVEQKYLRLIEKEIMQTATKGRNAGCHLWFTTQNFSGTISKEVMEQFKLRMGLYLSSATSDGLLGTPICSTIIQKGWMYANQNGRETPHNVKLFRVPFCPPDWINQKEGYIETLLYPKVSEKYDCKKTLYYSDKSIHELDELDEFLEKREDLKEYPNLFMLGPSATYSDSESPYHFQFRKDLYENLLIQSTNIIDRVKLLRIILRNIMTKKCNHIIITGDENTVTEFNDYRNTFVDSPPLLEKDGSSVMDMIEQLVGSIKEDSELHSKPTYIILDTIDKIKDLGIEVSRESSRIKMRLEALTNIIDDVDIHLIILAVNAAQSIDGGLIPKFNHILVSKGTGKNMRRINGEISDVLEKLDEGFCYYYTPLFDAPVRLKIYRSMVNSKMAEDIKV